MNIPEHIWLNDLQPPVSAACKGAYIKHWLSIAAFIYIPCGKMLT